MTIDLSDQTRYSLKHRQHKPTQYLLTPEQSAQLVKSVLTSRLFPTLCSITISLTFGVCNAGMTEFAYIGLLC